MQNMSYTIKEASSQLGIGTTRVYEEVRSGRLKAKKFGRRTLIPRTSLEEWINNLEDWESAKMSS